MNTHFPTRQQAQATLAWAEKQNPGRWVDHSQETARAAETIAQASQGQLEAEKAYVLGLLHDVGRYVGWVNLRHVYEGWKLMNEKGWPKVAQICLTHSFTTPDLSLFAGENDCTETETEELNKALQAAEYDLYDELIQLVDAICMAQGVCLVEKRLMDVFLRYGVKENSMEKVKTTLEIKDKFDQIIGRSIYELFPEVAKNTFT